MLARARMPTFPDRLPRSGGATEHRSATARSEALEPRGDKLGRDAVGLSSPSSAQVAFDNSESHFFSTHRRSSSILVNVHSSVWSTVDTRRPPPSDNGRLWRPFSATKNRSEYGGLCVGLAEAPTGHIHINIAHVFALSLSAELAWEGGRRIIVCPRLFRCV